MKLKIMSGACAVALVFASGQACAQEAGAVVYKNSWTGVRGGVIGGYGWGQSEISAIVQQGMSEDGSADLSGGMIGGLLGYDYDFGNGIVVGVVGDMSWSDVSGGGCIHASGGSCSDLPADMSVELNWLATARLRAGYAVDDLLVYGTGGLAFGSVEASLNSPFLNDVDSKTSFGWALGAGVEYRISDPVAIGLEYLYIDLGKETYRFSNGGVDGRGEVDLNVHTLRATLQLRF